MSLIQYLLSGDSVFIRNMEYDVSGNPIYLGAAKVGASDSSPSWHIKKITYDGDGNALTIKFANGTADFTNIWTSRDSYSYS